MTKKMFENMTEKTATGPKSRMGLFKRHQNNNQEEGGPGNINSRAMKKYTKQNQTNLFKNL